MNSEDQFKKSLQDKIASKEFPFDESEWEKAAAIIDSKRNGGSNRFIYFLSGLAILFAGYLNFQSMPQHVKAENTTNSSLAENREQVLMAENKSAEPNSEKSLPQKETKAKPNLTNEKTTHPKTISTVQEKEIKPEQETLFPEKSIKSNTIPQKINTLSKELETSEHASLNTTSENTSTIQSNTTNLNVKSSTEPLKSNTSKDDQTPLVENNVIAAQSFSEINSNTEEDKEVLNESKNIEPVLEKNNENEKTIPLIDPKSTLVLKDSSLQLNNASATPHNSLNFELGASYLFGWKNDQRRDANGLNPVIGLNYASNIYKNYWFSFGIQYNSVRNLSYSEKTSKVTRYKLGEESDVTTITPSKLYYLSVPFKAHCQFNESNAFGVSYVINYLFNVESKVDTYTQTLYGTSNALSYSSGGYSEGFRLFSSQVGLFYKRKLYKELWMNAEFVFGLNDIKEDSFFKLNSVERNTGLKITLTYNLFKH